MPLEMNVGMPSSLDLDGSYTIRVTCLDSNGGVVAGAKVGTTVITADFVTAALPGTEQQLAYGDWFLVPGPGA